MTLNDPSVSARSPAGLADLSVLIVDDEPGMRNFMGRILGPQCRRVETAASTAEAADWLSVARFDVVVLDNLLGKDRGLDWLARQRRQGYVPPVVLISAFADLAVAVEAMQAGAVDLILKPFRSAQLLTALTRSAEQVRHPDADTPVSAAPRLKVAASRSIDDLVGSSPAIRSIRAAIARVAPTSASVLLTGESGTGKEVAARMIHALSGRSKGDFVAVNCAALPADMAESELFGHVEGAFPGATGHRTGMFLHAQGGTLFLDEIGGLSLSIQAKLLRVIEDHRVRPLGSDQELPLDLRLVFATNTDLRTEVAAGRFREDLYHRINTLHLHMPPLRERAEDVPELARTFMARLSRDLGLPVVQVTPEIEQDLVAQDWSGNVRELRNVIERTLILGRFDDMARMPAANG